MSIQYSQDRQSTGAPVRRTTANPTARPTRPQPTGSDRFGDAQRPRTPRPAGSQPQRPAGAPRPANGQRPASGARPANGQTRRPANGARPVSSKSRKRKPNNKFYALIAAAIALIAIVVVLIVVLSKPKADPVSVNEVPTQAPTAVATEAADPAEQTTTASNASHSDSLAAMLGDSEAEVSGLSANEMASVEDLAINSNLPSEWMNVLFLGSDERWLNESARTDSMMICSINTNTGEVKLSSIMRDLAVNYDEIGKYNGTYRINAANYFGGERLAMRVINECFGMNIQYFVRVNFYGFQQIAQILGGVEMDITEEEKDEINYRIYQQARMAYYNGIDESALPNEFLETFGPDTHLDGRQTLAYARIRKLDGGDYARSERQRKVLVALMNKLQGADAATLLSTATAALPHVKTNLTPEAIINIGMKVLSSGLKDVDSFRLPINNSYVQDTRDGQDMLYDCDWAKNANELYYFIYE